MELFYFTGLQRAHCTMACAPRYGDLVALGVGAYRNALISHYRQMSPAEMVKLNGNIAEFRFDLGLEFLSGHASSSPIIFMPVNRQVAR